MYQVCRRSRECVIKQKIDTHISINCKQEGYLAAWRGCPAYSRLDETNAVTGKKTNVQVETGKKSIKETSNVQAAPPPKPRRRNYLTALVRFPGRPRRLERNTIDSRILYNFRSCKSLQNEENKRRKGHARDERPFGRQMTTRFSSLISVFGLQR
ncbi:hypothetical protein AVEN_272284-1 [Araneus ventricosus]|uniref:Uncharacterized protein n=1 Tax=Araneus ventricosus TaxID=182803 RepID=A0A4Y2TBB3_ARAVE|nr:hypothetical protein AVEN_272284-1 [Araneus ventricosus]